MECCAKLEFFLNEQELINIPNQVKIKINTKFNDNYNLIAELRNENSELNGLFESEQFKFEKEVSVYREQLQDSTEACTKLKLQVAELEESLNSVQKQWRDLQKSNDSSMLEFQSTKRDNELLQQEKRNLTEQLEKRRSDIEKLNSDLKSLLDQVTSANEAKFEAIADSEEAKLKESSLQHQVNRLEQEKELLNQQIHDLNAELSQKNTEIHTLKREKSSNILELKALLDEKADEIHLVQKRVDCYKEVLDEKDQRIEALAEKIRQRNQSMSKSEEQFNLELNAQQKLIELHRSASEDNQKRVQELMRAFEEAQKLLKESGDSTEEMERHVQDVEAKCRVQLEEKKAEIIRLKDELRRVKDSFSGMNHDTIEKIFPVAAATSKVLHSGMTLTDLYVEYTRLQEELQQQKNENGNLTRELKQIIAEIEEKTPVINQRMLEYDKLNETISLLKSQLANALSDYEKVLEERNDSKRMCNLSGRDNARLKAQVLDLSKQVRILLKEVEEARGGTIKNYCEDSRITEDLVASSDDLTAAKIISRHLVTFRDIEELQLRNQQLLVTLRDLSQQHEELEKKVSSQISIKFENEITNLSAQLEDLQKKRTKQSELLETILRQRDMYRVLLTTQGFSESLLGQTEGLPDPQLKETKTALTQIQAEFDNYKKEKSENERMLTEQMDKMRSDVSDMRIQNAKLASQCEYSEERVKLLQSNLDTYKKEYVSFKEKNKQHSTMLVTHQKTINSLRQDLMAAQEKMAQSDVTIENLKKERNLLKEAESRVRSEKESAIRERQQQSRVMANLQAVQNNLERIESETKRNLQYQVEKYEKENSILKTKVENANEEYRSAVKIWEKQKKELQSKIDAEVERNRKVHDELVNAYSKVHSLNQDVINAKAQVSSSTSVPASSPVKTPIKEASPAMPSEIKLLKEKLNEAQSKLKVLEDKLALSNKSHDQYLSMCRDLELRVTEQDEINKHLQKSMDSALQSSTEARMSLEKTLEIAEKNYRDLMEDNMKLTQDHDSQVNELQKKVADSIQQLESLKNQAEQSKLVADQARIDCKNQMKLMEDVQEKYERELLLHAQDIKTLSEIKDEHYKCSVRIEKLTDTAKAAEQTLQESKESWARQEGTLRSEIEALKSRIMDMEACNQNLHNQLELMGTQMAALQSKNWEDSPYSSIQTDLKDTQHLLQVIQFIKKEKEIVSTQFDVSQSENVRLKMKVEQLDCELGSTKAELKDIMNNIQAKAASEAQHTELLKKIEMMNLLSESNNLLRMEKESISEAKSQLEEKLLALQDKFQPLCEKEKELSQSVDMLSAENGALRQEVKSWQSRTNQLLEQSHRVGPQEYKNMVRDLEELKQQKERISEELQRKQAEVSQVSSTVTNLRKEIDGLRVEVKEKSQDFAKTTEENAELHRTLLQIKKIGRKYKTQYDELKNTHDALVAKMKVSESADLEKTVQELQKKAEEAVKVIKELREELNKQKESAELAKKDVENVQSKATEKEDKAKKLLAQFRQRYSQLNKQKDNLTVENTQFTKQIEDLKQQLSSLMESQEEHIQLNAKTVRLENELKKANEQRILETDYLQKQYDDLMQKMSQQKQTMKPSMGLGERSSSGLEPLTANIRPITSPSISGTSSGLRPHPHAMSVRPPPTASIRPIAIGSSAPQPPRTATVLPTPSVPEEVSVPPVPHATVAPTSITVTVSASVPEVLSSTGPDEMQDIPIPSGHLSSSPLSALVPPHIDVPEVTDVESSPTTSVIVSPPTTQTQVVNPTVKRPRDNSPSPQESADVSLKRIRMISESPSQLQPFTSVVPPTQIVSRRLSQPSTSTQAFNEAESVPDKGLSAPQPICEEVESLEEERQNIDWENPEEAKIEEDFEIMEEEISEVEEDVEQMQGLDVRTPDDEDMIEEQPDDAEDMSDQPTSTVPDIDLIDSVSDIQMDADSGSLQNAPSESSMAPPPILEPSPVVVEIIPPAPRPAAAPRLQRQTPVSRQHLTPFTIPGQGSNFEDGDDCIVPSTPTLFVPRRADGFAEAVSSPQVPQVRFLFSSSDNSPTQQGFSQLATQGALGVDDTRMDLSQFDEGGRTLPSTSVQVSPPVEAVVPDESSSTSIECVIPIIRVDLVEDVIEAALETVQGESPEVEASSSAVESEDQQQAIIAEVTDSVSDDKTEDSNLIVSETKPDTASLQEGEATNKTAINPTGATLRKPIIWHKKEVAATPPPDTPPIADSPVATPTPQTTRGRRRSRFAGAGAAYAASGRSSVGAPWQPTGRRGRGATRRRGGMY